AVAIGATERDRIDGMKQLEVMIANIFEVPSGAAVSGNSSLPDRMRGGYSSGRGKSHSVDDFRFGDIREREALGSKLDFGPPHIFERPQIGAYSEVVGDSLTCSERQIAAA